MTFPTFSSPAPDAFLEDAYDSTYEDAPWGEQQEQVDWLESDDAYDTYEYDCELTEDDYTHDGMDD